MIQVMNNKFKMASSAFNIKKIENEYSKLRAINGQFVYYLSIGSKYHCSISYSKLIRKFL